MSKAEAVTINGRVSYKISGFPGYTYDPVRKVVLSNRRSGFPNYEMQWNEKNGLTRVSLLGAYGYVRRLTPKEVLDRVGTLPELSWPFANKVSPIEKDPTARKAIVGSVVGDSYSFSARPKVHDTTDLARAEAARLANLNPGKEFVVLEVVGSCQVGGLVWK